MAIPIALGAEAITASMPGVPTIPATTLLKSLVLTIWQARGIIPDVPLGVPTYPDVYGLVAGMVGSFGASLPVEIIVALLAVTGFVVNKRMK